jgi:hypothetical protein
VNISATQGALSNDKTVGLLERSLDGYAMMLVHNNCWYVFGVQLCRTSKRDV